MSAERDVNRIVRSWIREDEHDSADAILGIVLSRLDTTPQRRSWWPARRFEQMRTTQILVAAAAVVVVAVLGFTLLPRLSGTGQTTPTVATTATPLPSPSAPVMPKGSVPPGTYRVMTFTNKAFMVTVPAGWRREDNFLTSGDGTVETDAFDGNGVAFASWTISHVYADSCDWRGTLQAVESADEIVAALTEQAGHDTSEPLATTIGGQSATRLDLSLDAAFQVGSCDGAIVRLWPDAGPQEQYGLPIYPGQTTTVHVVDHGTSATLIMGITNDDSSPADVNELEGILSSIEFVP